MSSVDFLDEDIEIRNQRYCVLSYTLPPDIPKGKGRVGYNTPMVKFRGAYSTTEECDDRIKRLKSSDTYFHMYIAPVGVWGPLLTDEQHKDSGTDAVYMNKDMNDFMKEYKQCQDNKTKEFEERKSKMVAQATEEGSKEGQARLAEQKENAVSVIVRFEQTKQNIENLQRQLKEAEDLYDSTKTLLDSFTVEEINEAKEKLNTPQPQ